MTAEEFDKTRFGAKTIIEYKNVSLDVKGVDFEERLIAIEFSGELTWVRCENCTIIFNK